MIVINLLPKELQRAARTPKGVFFAFAGGIAVMMIAVCVYAYLWFNVLVIKERVESKQADVAALEGEANEVDALEDDIRDYKEREEAIIAIKTKRILWSRKLDELVKLTPATIWITRMDMKELGEETDSSRKDAEKTGGYLDLRCFSSGVDVSRMTRYRQGLKGERDFYLNFLGEKITPDNFYADFMSINKPSWQFVHLPGFRQENNILFNVHLDLKQDAVRSKAGKRG